MKYCRAEAGRIFILRLEHGEILHEAIEAFCARNSIQAAEVGVLGGADRGSRLVVGPRDGNARPIVPLVAILDGVHEASGTGTVFPDEAGAPVLHLHLACGRGRKTVTGCARTGVLVWQVMEVVIRELTGTEAARRLDPDTGFELLSL